MACASQPPSSAAAASSAGAGACWAAAAAAAEAGAAPGVLAVPPLAQPFPGEVAAPAGAGGAGRRREPGVSPPGC